MVPLRTALIIDGPPGPVRAALRRGQTWQRAARAMGWRLERSEIVPDLREGELLRLRLCTPVEYAFVGSHLTFRVTDASPRLGLAGGLLAGAQVAVLTAATQAGTLTTIDLQVTARPGWATPALRRPLLRFGEVLLGIAALVVAEREVAANAGADKAANPGASAGADPVTREPVVDQLTRDPVADQVVRDPVADLPARPGLVVAGVIVRDGRVLLGKRADHGGGWELPGGKVEPAESEQQALRRELREELGVRVLVDGRVGPDVPLTGGWLLRAHRAHLLDGDVAPTVHDELRWVAAPELDGIPLLAADRQLLPALRALLGTAS